MKIFNNIVLKSYIEQIMIKLETIFKDIQNLWNFELIKNMKILNNQQQENIKFFQQFYFFLIINYQLIQNRKLHINVSILLLNNQINYLINYLMSNLLMIYYNKFQIIGKFILQSKYLSKEKIYQLLLMNKNSNTKICFLEIFKKLRIQMIQLKVNILINQKKVKFNKYLQINILNQNKNKSYILNQKNMKLSNYLQNLFNHLKNKKKKANHKKLHIQVQILINFYFQCLILLQNLLKG